MARLMYPLRLSAADKRAYTSALRGDPEPKVGHVSDDTDESGDDPKLGDVPTDPVADPGANPMRLVTANVKHTMARASIEADVQKVAGLGSIILWQEAHFGPFKDAIRQYLPSASWDHLCFTDTNVISVKRAHWDVLQSTIYPMHDKWPGGGDPARTLTTALVQLRGTSIQFLVIGSHFVSSAWNPTVNRHKAWKQRNWNVNYAKFQSLVLDAKSKGITVVGGGDWNRPDVAKFTASQDWFRRGHIDNLFGVQATGGASYSLQAGQTVALNSDHNALVVQLGWTAGTNALVGGYLWPGL